MGIALVKLRIYTSEAEIGDENSVGLRYAANQRKEIVGITKEREVM